MSYTSHKHHHFKHQAKHPRISWGETSRDYQHQVYSTSMEPILQHQSYRAPDVSVTYNKNYEEQLPRAYPTKLANTIAENNEDVDKEAEDFIKLEHKKFEQLMSIKTG